MLLHIYVFCKYVCGFADYIRAAKLNCNGERRRGQHSWVLVLCIYENQDECGVQELLSER